MHLLLADGAVLSAPETLTGDVDGARRLAALYSFPAPGPSGVHVRAMMNTTLDGAVAGADGTSGTLRNPDDSFVFGVLRALADVVLVGAQTVREEDYRRPLGREDLLSPSLRPSGAPRPALAIWSRSGELPVTVEPAWPTYLITPRRDAREASRRSGIPEDQVIPAESTAEALQGLAERGLQAVQAEGGPSSLGRLAAAGALDELCFSTTHRTVGGASSRVLSGAPHDQRWALETLLVGEHATVSRHLRR